jgi:hypothetical protein
MQNQILAPVFAMVALTAAVLVTMFAARVTTMRKKRIHIEKLADNARFDDLLIDACNPADNFENLFEMPVHFYVLCILLFVMGRVDRFYVQGAWAYVALRFAHSFIHCTYNRVKHRFYVFALSCAVLIALWVRFGLQLTH